MGQAFNKCTASTAKTTCEERVYNFDIEYKPGNTMLLSDTLSRLPNQRKFHLIYELMVSTKQILTARWPL